MTEEEFKNKVLPYSRKLYPMLKGILKDEEETRDALQELMFKLWRNRGELDNCRSQPAYIMAMARNYSFDVLKKKRPVRMDEKANPHYLNLEARETNPDVREKYEQVQKIIASLPEKYRAIIQLRDIDGFSFEEIMEFTGLEITNIRVVLSRARQKVKEDRDKIESLALVTHSDRATSLVELQGENIDLSTVSELNRALNLHGLENLYKINSHSARGFYVPAPDVPSEEKIREMVERQRELIEKQHHLTEEQRQKIEIQARAMADKQREMAEKYREMADKYHRQPIFLSAPGDSVEYYIDGKKVTARDVKKINPEDIERVEVNKGKGENKKGIIRITTRK